MPQTPEPDLLLTIGEVARESGLTASALRFYDREGVLVPADVDALTGYRRYAVPQVRAARLLASLRRVGMPLVDDGIPEGLWPPGSLRNAGTMHAARTCACAACEATFRAAGDPPRGAPGAWPPDTRTGPDRAAG